MGSNEPTKNKQVIWSIAAVSLSKKKKQQQDAKTVVSQKENQSQRTAPHRT